MAQNKRTIDPDLFTDAQGAKELEANALRESLSYDAYGSQTEFTVVVLTKPIPQAASDAATVLTGPEMRAVKANPQLGGGSQSAVAQNIPTSPLEGGISFKGRILGTGFISPHASIPDPCNLEMNTSPGAAIKIINLHTTFSSVAGYSGRIPNIGDTVTVKLQTGDIKFNLQNAIFTEIFDSAVGSERANTMAQSCTNLASRFADFDPDEDLGDMEFAYGDNTLEGPNIPNITRQQAQPLIDSIVSKLEADPSALGYTKLPVGKCGFPSDFFGSDPSASEKALLAEYPVQDCIKRQIGNDKNNNSVSVYGHPVWISTLQSVYDAARSQSWFTEWKQTTGVDPILFSYGYRSVETQIYLRIKNGGHRTYEQVMSSPTSPTCNPPTARPGKSRHNLGLAIDFGGIIGHKTRGASSEAHKWLESQGLNGNSTFKIKNFQKENWHWSVDGF